MGKYIFDFRSLVTSVRPPAYAHGCVVIHRAGGRTGTGDPGTSGLGAARDRGPRNPPDPEGHLDPGTRDPGTPGPWGTPDLRGDPGTWGPGGTPDLRRDPGPGDLGTSGDPGPGGSSIRLPGELQQQRLGSHREAIWCPGDNNNCKGLHSEAHGAAF